MFKKAGYLTLVITIVLALVLSGYSCGTKTASKLNTSPHSPPRTGNITTGTKVAAVSQTLAVNGGMITVSKPGDPLDGFVMNVPAGSYNTASNFQISYSPITNQTFGSDINPITPLITIDNGGVKSNQLLYVRIPAKIPSDQFAMAFIYDAKTKQLEGVPMVAADADSVTIETSHFCDMFISMISKALLKKDIDSSFKPGVDDWQFVNRGSYLAVGGQCEGQSLAAMWYYCTQPDGSNAHLFGRYDNNGDQPATPDLWEDDSLGYRLCSVVQNVMNQKANNFWMNAAGKMYVQQNGEWKTVEIPLGLSDEMTWELFAYSIQATNEPQLVGLDDTKSGSGHCVICYRVNEGSLYIADPNYPGQTERRVVYSNGKLQPYNSGANANEIAKGNNVLYDSIEYYAKTTIVPWDIMAALWGQFQNKTIGNGKFPAYTLNYVNLVNNIVQKVPLVDGTKTAFDAIAISASPNFGIDVYRDGVKLAFDAKGNFDLNPGNNNLGIAIFGKVNGTGDWEYIDFKYINVIYEAETTTTTAKTTAGGHPVITSFTGPTDGSQMKAETVQYSIKISGGKPPYTETWTANTQVIMQGKNLETVNIPVGRLRNNGAGWYIYLQVEDADGEEALWIDSVGVGQAEFVYGLTYANEVVTQPTIPYKAYGAK